MNSDLPAGNYDSAQWALLEQAASEDSALANKAISKIAKLYWAPLYVFGRSEGLGVSDAEDAVQLFFGKLSDESLIEKMDSEKGGMRTFFMTLMEQAALMIKDGGLVEKQFTFAVDKEREEEWFNGELTVSATAEALFEKRWALSVLEQSLLSIRRGYEKKGQANVFDALKPHLGWSGGDESNEEVAHRLEMSEGAVKVAVHRLRQKYKQTLQSQIAETIGSADSELIRGEITHLFAALS